MPVEAQTLVQIQSSLQTLRSRAGAARKAHNLEVGGSIPSSATNKTEVELDKLEITEVKLDKSFKHGSSLSLERQHSSWKWGFKSSLPYK